MLRALPTVHQKILKFGPFPAFTQDNNLVNAALEMYQMARWAKIANILDDFAAQLAPQCMDQEFDDITFDLFPPSIDAVFKVAARQNGARSHQQGLQEREPPGWTVAQGSVVDYSFSCSRVKRIPCRY